MIGSVLDETKKHRYTILDQPKLHLEIILRLYSVRQANTTAYTYLVSCNVLFLKRRGAVLNPGSIRSFS